MPDTRLTVGEPVARDDGRFYVPVSIEPAAPDLSPIVLRVASDAFVDLDAAIAFAGELVRRWTEVDRA